MAGHLHLRPLFRSSTITICDVGCRPHCSEPGPEEWANIHEIVFPRTGAFIKHVGRHSVVADCNHVLFFNRHQTYRISHPVAGGDDCTVLTFAPDVLAEALARHDPVARDRPDRPFRFRCGPREPGASLLLHKLRRHAAAPARDDIAIEEMGLELLDSVVRHVFRNRGQRRIKTRPATTAAHRESADATKMLLAARFRSRLSLSEVARAVHCSRFHLARLFRQQTGLSIHEYLSRLRLAQALEHVGNGERDLTRLALDLGYSSHSHFSAAFRRQFGRSPSDIRRTATSADLREMSTNLTA